MNNETKIFINIFENDADFIGWKKDANSELENRWVCTSLFFRFLIYINNFFYNSIYLDNQTKNPTTKYY